METVSLNGRWLVRQNQEADAEWLAATVPGCVHTDLLQNDLIPEPFYRDNELRVRWIEKTDWEYRTRFDVSREVLDRNNVELLFEGLDTYATVILNGVEILAGTDHPEAAAQLVEFMLSPRFQEDIPLNMFVYPANEDAALPEVFVEYATVPTDPVIMDPAAIEENRDRWLAEWATIVR